MYIRPSCMWFLIGSCLLFGRDELLMGFISSLYKVKSLILCILVADKETLRLQTAKQKSLI